MLQTAGNIAFSLFALRSGPAGRTSLLCYTMPFWVVLLGWPLLRERPGRLQWAALALAAAGLGAGLRGRRRARPGTWPAAVLAICSGLSWAGGTVLARRLLVREKVDTLALTAWQMLFGGLALWAGALAFPGRPTDWSPYLVFAVLYEVLPATALAWLLWTALLKHVDAGVASLAILAAPLLGLLGERRWSWASGRAGSRRSGWRCSSPALLLVGPLAIRQARAGAR